MTSLFASAALLASCASAASPDAEAPSVTAPTSDDAGEELEATSIRVGFASSPDFTQIANYKWLQDLRDRDGLDVGEAYFESSQDSFRALVAGEVDLAFGTLSSAISLVSQGGDAIKAVVSDMKAPDYILVAQDDLEDLSDVEGRRVGISTPGDISDTLTRVLLQREGIDVSGVKFLQIGGTSARMSALLEGQIDAGPAHAADGLSAMTEGQLKNLYSYGNAIGDYLQQVVFVRDSWAQDHPVLMQTAVARFIESVRWAASSKDEYLSLAEQYVEGLDPSIAAEAYDVFTDIEMFAVNGGMSRDLLENTVSIEQEVGTLGADVPPIDQWADPSYVEAYLRDSGEV